ncbi:hypothetical protein NY2A_b095L [Paramecium bursaria Chlorella virus NY2A]|uniref:Uncharacterized protein b095L n=1 Tax=Paramecium bursaria Chlorella virus NY2A TaxID=46021 RepID=A7IVX0_PBCVN|nr:hypothetical protein NY2A_b095L [Paramecium bursaria Chlorella virus NY2A]YP_001498164.1 hypothetical protein AR158_c082L [Paramecium bursaria Chlorella virus AR158]ABT14494.1 hypothetical protein NY2A_b095L [Paramecium bursaria Chlorella virus NY2A]ABU43628.1 hypothetical protein AR158_c082L [Paramecium bursaria Chlorella virus AR158]
MYPGRLTMSRGHVSPWMVNTKSYLNVFQNSSLLKKSEYPHPASDVAKLFTSSSFISNSFGNLSRQYSPSPLPQ